MRWETESTRAPFGRAAKRFKDTGLGLSIEVGRYLVQQQHGRVCRCGAGDGQKLPLALREHPVRTHRIIAARQVWMAASRPASFAAFLAISSVMPGSPSVICSSTVPGTRAKCCSTQPMQVRRSASVMSATSTPPMVTDRLPGDKVPAAA